MTDSVLQPTIWGRTGEITTLRWMIRDDPRPLKILWLFGGLGIGKTALLSALKAELGDQVLWVEHRINSHSLPPDQALLQAHWRSGKTLAFACEDCDDAQEAIHTLLEAVQARAEVVGEATPLPRVVLLATSRRQPPPLPSGPNLLSFKLRMGPLGREDAFGMLRALVGCDFQPSAEARVWALTAGYPAFVSLFAEIIRREIGPTAEGVSLESVDRMLFAATRHSFFRELWQTLSLMEKSVLVAVATWAERRGGWATLSDIQGEIQDHVGPLMGRTIFPRFAILYPEDVHKQVHVWLKAGQEQLTLLANALARLNEKIQIARQSAPRSAPAVDARAARDLLRAERRLQDLLAKIPPFGQRLLERLDSVPAKEVHDALARFQPDREILVIVEVVRSPLVLQALRNSPDYPKVREEEQALIRLLEDWNPVKAASLDAVLRDLVAQSLITCEDGKFRILPQLLHAWILAQQPDLVHQLWR